MNLDFLFKNSSYFGGTINKGDLISFSYIFHKTGHDPSPNVIVTDTSSFYIRGLNIHYLTFPYIRKLLQDNCDNRLFSYRSIKDNSYLVSSFRQYKKTGIRNLKKLDCKYLLNLMASIRAITPNEVEAIRQTINDQLSKMSQERIDNNITGEGR
jgi:hypothetical protein